MKLNFGGFVPLSTVDFPGISCCTVFFRGCSERCGYCHNRHLWEGEDYRDIEEIKQMIMSSYPFISGVAFSGGEPTEQPEQLKELIKFCKENNLKVCLHTNAIEEFDLKDVDKVIVGLKLKSRIPRHKDIRIVVITK